MMQRVFTTDGMPEPDRFRRWREVCEGQLVPMAQSCIGNGSFEAVIDAASIGSLNFTKFNLSNVKASTNSRTIRHPNNKTDQLFLSVVLSGSVHACQNDQSNIDRAGDLSIRDTNSPWTLEHRGRSSVLAIGVPRERLETAVGSARRFSGLTMGGDLAVTTLARNFLCDLLRKGDTLSPFTAERLTSIGIDLIAASIAERMAMAVPESLHNVLLVQRAKAFIQDNLADQDLDPSRVAAVLGVSVRRIHELFRIHGRSVGDWIWQQRLEVAALRLGDPAGLHVPVGMLAYNCGFKSLAHFSRRFRDRYGLSPRDYRHRQLSAARQTT